MLEQLLLHASKRGFESLPSSSAVRGVISEISVYSLASTCTPIPSAIFHITFTCLSHCCCHPPVCLTTLQECLKIPYFDSAHPRFFSLYKLLMHICYCASNAHFHPALNILGIHVGIFENITTLCHWVWSHYLLLLFTSVYVCVALFSSIH